MLDPVLLERFKRLTREDAQIADILAQELDCRNVRSILDVGAGRGVISRALAAKTDVFPEIEIIEPEAAFEFPSTVRVHRQNWEQVHLGRKFDLVVMSHVIGHFPMRNRGATVARVLNSLTPSGRAVIVENAPAEPFWSLNLELGKRQTMQYVIDFGELEDALRRRGGQTQFRDHVIPLFLGHQPEEQLELLNVLFPKHFSAADVELVRESWSRLFPAADGVLPLSQRIYVVQAESGPAVP